MVVKVAREAVVNGWEMAVSRECFGMGKSVKKRIGATFVISGVIFFIDNRTSASYR